MAMTLITTNTSSNAASSSFTSSIDSTYKLYIFKWYDVNPATNEQVFRFQCSTDGGSNYNITVTSTHFQSKNNEGDSDSGLEYRTDQDVAQGTGYIPLMPGIGSGGDESGAGELHLFNPSSGTYVKHWYAEEIWYHGGDAARHTFQGGYFNTTSAINAISFNFESGNMDGTIKMYGVG